VPCATAAAAAAATLLMQLMQQEPMSHYTMLRRVREHSPT
jgi:hypothetical protein